MALWKLLWLFAQRKQRRSFLQFICRFWKAIQKVCFWFYPLSINCFSKARLLWSVKKQCYFFMKKWNYYIWFNCKNIHSYNIRRFFDLFYSKPLPNPATDNQNPYCSFLESIAFFKMKNTLFVSPGRLISPSKASKKVPLKSFVFQAGELVIITGSAITTSE